ncbi:MAG: hypothetical protein DRH12_17145 [Deltaproteobacteria bacterium]|nr:MAG: hypothetical protein DRH12_17145 [Deltaproteobacteria bacterium]
MLAAVNRLYLELDGRLYAYDKGGLNELVDLSEITGGLLVSDFPGSISRVMEVETGPKFADVMARRRIEEEGEFDQAPSIIAHWLRKRAKNRTDIFVTALPYSTYEQYLDHSCECEEPLLIYCLYGLLHEVIKRKAKKRPVAVVFQHGRVADLVVGHRKRIYFANRAMAFDESQEQIQNLWDMVLSDIRATEAENKITVDRVIYLSWIDSVPPPWSGDLGFQLLTMPEEVVDFNGNTYRCSLITAVRQLHPGCSISGGADKWAYRAKSAIFGLNLVLLMASIIAFGGYFYFSQRAATLQTKYLKMKHEVDSLSNMRPSAQPVPGYGDILSFIKRLERASRLPGYKELVNDITDAWGQPVTVETLNSTYGKDGMVEELRGYIDAPFAAAYKVYQRALLVLSKKGYEIEDSSFSTSIKESRFSLKLLKRQR